MPLLFCQGERGYPGESGQPGQRGAPGERGPQGQSGESGPPVHLFELHNSRHSPLMHDIEPLEFSNRRRLLEINVVL